MRCNDVQAARWTFVNGPGLFGRFRDHYLIYPTGDAGTRWGVWALGGLGCGAARGWVADLAAGVVDGDDRIGGIRTEPQWSCLTGGKMLVGLCIRSSNPRGPLDFRGVFIHPEIGIPLPFDPSSFEDVLGTIVRFNEPGSPREALARHCETLNVPSAPWTVDGRRGEAWAYGVRGGYPCALAKAELARLAEWATMPIGTRDGGVDGRWRCTTNAGSVLRCNRLGGVVAYKIVLLPTPALESPARTRERMLAALL